MVYPVLSLYEPFSGLANDDFLILPHPEVARYEQRRAGDRERWLAGMRKLQAMLPGS